MEQALEAARLLIGAPLTLRRIPESKHRLFWNSVLACNCLMDLAMGRREAL